MKIGAHRQTDSINIFAPLLQQGEGKVEKTILTALFLIDKFSFISPLRWLGPTTDIDGRLVSMGISCGDGKGSTKKSGDTSGDAGNDMDAGNIFGFDASSVSEQKDAGVRMPLPAECKPGEMETCGPCDVGTKNCGPDYLWEACRHTVAELVRSCYAGSENTAGVGLCKTGTQHCSSNQWGACMDEVLPQSEICDLKDNNCDGRIDEGDAAPAEEVCDGIDNDCNGEIDEEGCGSKIGDPCRNTTTEASWPFADCDAAYCIGSRYYEGGYCTELISKWYPQTECPPGRDFKQAVCVKDSQFGIDSDVYQWRSYSLYYCVVTCESDTDCRTGEDYVCKQIVDSAIKACLPRHEDVRLGTGVCATTLQ